MILSVDSIFLDVAAVKEEIVIIIKILIGSFQAVWGPKENIHSEF